MALNVYMHSRNPYKNKKPSFRMLAAKYPFFAEAIETEDDGRMCPDFKQPKFLAALARALLLEDFGLDVNVPVDRLIPTVPLRLNYILWVEDILSAMKIKNSPPLILDIGTGSCCIYPIIGAAKNGWNFIGSEFDVRNYNHSLETIVKNGLENKIALVRVSDNTLAPLKQVLCEYSGINRTEPSRINVDVVMANPPFFEDVADSVGADSTRSLSRPPPKSASSAARQESQTLGGEVGFARRVAEDSLLYKENIGVFTVMLGKKRSVPALRRVLREMGITQTSVYEMCQGRVMRKERKFHRPPLTYTLPPIVSCLPKYSKKCLLQWLSEELKQLKMRVLKQKNKAYVGGYHLYAVAKEDTWTHARRRRREAMLSQRQQEQQQQQSDQNQQVLSTEERPLNGERKRVFPNEEAESTESAQKRRRTEEICGEGVAWIEEISRNTSNITFDESEVIFKANFHVMSEKKAHESFTDEDEDENEDCDDVNSGAHNYMETDEDDAASQLIISVEWLGGKDREMANRVLCYLKNKLK